jgi:hypothetical protein
MGRDDRLDALAAQAGARATRDLLDELLDLAEPDRLDQADRDRRNALITVLTGRHPEAAAAYRAWSASGAEAGAARAIICALVACDGCGAELGEECRPGCLADEE